MLHYQILGNSGLPLVLIHGYCEDNTCFNKQVLFFKDHYRVITIDLPGFGKSATVDGITMDSMAEVVKEILHYKNIEKCVMMGHSMGGYVTLAFAEKYPEMLLGFGLIHSTSIADSVERIEKRKQVISFVNEHGKEPYIKSFIPTLFNEGAAQEDIEHAVHMGLNSRKKGITEAAKAMMKRPDRTHVLLQSKVPVFFAIGAKDQIIPESALFDLAAKCKISQVAYLQRSAHMGMLEEADLLNAEIQKFMDLVSQA